MRRDLCLLAFFIALANRANAQCANSDYPTGSVSGLDYVWLNSTASMQDSGEAWASSSAVGEWSNGCFGFSQSGGIPIPTNSRPYMGSYATLNVVYQPGYYSQNNHACGLLAAAPGGSGGIIYVYQYALDPAGNQVACNSGPGGYGSIVAHELGHYYGLKDLYPATDPGCDTQIMSQVNFQSHYVHGSECQKANDINQVRMEWNPTTCNEPCAQSCDHATGNCPAFNQSPILLNVRGAEIRLTAPEVRFDARNNGATELMAWTQPDSETAFLVLDRNGNGLVDNGGELFGNNTTLPNGYTADNGYLALGWYDKNGNGGNGDGLIDNRDVIYGQLRLWFDGNHDGIAQPGELRTLSDMGVISICLHYALSRRIDRSGNEFRYRSTAEVSNRRGGTRTVDVYDVYLRTE